VTTTSKYAKLVYCLFQAEITWGSVTSEGPFGDWGYCSSDRGLARECKALSSNPSTTKKCFKVPFGLCIPPWNQLIKILSGGMSLTYRAWNIPLSRDWSAELQWTWVNKLLSSTVSTAHTTAINLLVTSLAFTAQGYVYIYSAIPLKIFCSSSKK
jgi:hypothetical protein